MGRWLKSILVVFCLIMPIFGGFGVAATAQQTSAPPPTAQLPPRAMDHDAKQRELKRLRPTAQHSQVSLDSVIQDEPTDRSKVCTIEESPAKISCVFATTHVVGGSCTCKVGDKLREGRFLQH